MARLFGFVLGTLMLLNGISDTISPRFGFSIWERGLKRYFPEPLNKTVREYSRLSTPALRYLSVWEICIALTMLWLASRTHE